jgi:hypothetical protein
MTGFADITMGKVKVIPARYRLLNGMSAHITGKGLHDQLLKNKMPEPASKPDWP